MSQKSGNVNHIDSWLGQMSSTRWLWGQSTWRWQAPCRGSSLAGLSMATIAQSTSEWMNMGMHTSSSPLCWCFCTWMLGHTILTIYYIHHGCTRQSISTTIGENKIVNTVSLAAGAFSARQWANNIECLACSLPLFMHICRYHSPTAYSFIAMSPFELVFYDSIFIAPLFLFPVHAAVYVGNLIYVYYFGLVDHSGIKMTSIFPWQPDTMFHDDHHR